MCAHRTRSSCVFFSGLSGLLLAALPLAAGAMSGNCRLANQPAATLLVPYFEANLADPQGRTTLLSINNAAPRPTLARVVLWTDWGVPTLAFDVYLTGYDVQTLNVRDLFNGSLPGTGPGISSSGPLSQAGTSFPGCTAESIQSPRVGLPQQAFLKAAHTGRQLPNSQPAMCAATLHAQPSVVTGYITVDTVNRCSPPTITGTANTPADPAYFAKGGTGLASDDNSLWGDVFLINPQQNQAASQPAVAIVADSDFFQGGAYTFYGRFNGFSATDDRMPLSSLYYVRFFNGGSFTGGTDLLVWRDNRMPTANPAPCGSSPSWASPGEDQLVFFDEQENAGAITNSNAFPVATQRVHVGSTALAVQPDYGWLMLDLWHADGTHAQGWVTALFTASGRFATGHDAMRADDLCNFGP